MFRRVPRPPAGLPWPAGGFLVGGAVRNLLSRQMPEDFDWLVPDPEAAARTLAEEVGGRAFALDPERGFWRVVGGEALHDLTPLPAEGLEADLRRRDFTVNAMAMAEGGELTDPTGGRADLRAGRLRAVAETNLREDTLRPLRAARFVATLGFALEPETEGWAREVGLEQREGRLPLPAPERAQEELSRLLLSADPATGLEAADRLGLLEVYLPELAEGRGVEQFGLHHLDVLDHGVEALRRLVATFPEADLATRWAALLHDVGKPASRSWDSVRERWSFFGHDRVGAGVARSLLERLRYPRALAERVARLVDRHMLRLPGDERGARRFVHRHREVLPDLLRVMLADREAARGERASAAGRHGYQVGMSLVLAALEEPVREKPLLDGSAIMDLLGLAPGPPVGEALALLREAEAVGDATDEASARRLLRGWAQARGLEPPADDGGV